MFWLGYPLFDSWQGQAHFNNAFTNSFMNPTGSFMNSYVNSFPGVRLIFQSNVSHHKCDTQ